ncbi:MAG: hypothetical protein CVT67_08380 [Actinobacteria bacterium HGW-Actinobacteria-7]|jgi:hypothetical protein|nr:MAG: hypothetical protein CVT67_08380 [Actinobacteria bacterium HGW-Actinobacteria-7]
MNHNQMVVGLATCLCVVALAANAGCSNPTITDSSPNNRGGMMGGNGSSGGSGNGPNGNPGGGMMGNGNPGGQGNGNSGTGSYASDGERIYLTGVGADGRDISRTAPAVSQGSLMMGGGGCGSCHAADGRGATIKMMMGTAIEAPDITYDALIKEGFTDATIQKAIVDGLDEAGKPLEDAMPRWRMNSADMNATIAYLKVLSAQ